MAPCSAHSGPLFIRCPRKWSLLISEVVHVGGNGYFGFGSDTEQTLFNLCDRMLRGPDAPPASEEMVAPAHPQLGPFPSHVARSALPTHMARENWIENLVCRRCKKDGIAALSTEDSLSWVCVESVPEGFRTVQSEYGVSFCFASCNSPAEL
jgi:hypothetical protein